MKLEQFLSPYTHKKKHSKWIKDLNVRPETIKLLRGKHRQYIPWHKSQQGPLWPTSYSMEIKINKCDLIKLRCFCTAKETINKIKRQLSQWEEISANEANDKGLISKIHNIKAQYQKNKNSPIKKWAEDLNRHFSTEDIQVANKHMKRCSTSLIIRKMHIKTIIRYHLTPLRMPIIKKKSTNNKGWRGCGEKRTLLHCWWECKMIQPLRRTVGRFLKN